MSHVVIIIGEITYSGYPQISQHGIIAKVTKQGKERKLSKRHSRVEALKEELLKSRVQEHLQADLIKF